MVPSVLGLQLIPRLHLHQWPLLGSYNVKSQVLTMIPSCLQNQYLGNLYSTKFSCCHEVQPQLPLEHSLCVLTLSKHFPEDFASVVLVSS